ncbi:MAG: radical protein, partial [Verrucomicrobiales bacterium]|nr:radical protein [Verrucomicrobiales bacterium]
APGSKEKVLGRVRDMRGGKLYDAQWGTRMTGEGFFADELHSLFQLSRRRAGFPKPCPDLSIAAFRVPGAVSQLELGF